MEPHDDHHGHGHGHGHSHGAHTDPPTLVDQSLEELEFQRSVCAVAQSGQTAKLQSLLERRRGPAGVTGWGLHGEDGGAGRSGHTVRPLLGRDWSL